MISRFSFLLFCASTSTHPSFTAAGMRSAFGSSLHRESDTLRCSFCPAGAFNLLIDSKSVVNCMQSADQDFECSWPSSHGCDGVSLLKSLPQSSTVERTCPLPGHNQHHSDLLCIQRLQLLPALISPAAKARMPSDTWLSRSCTKSNVECSSSTSMRFFAFLPASFGQRVISQRTLGLRLDILRYREVLRPICAASDELAPYVRKD